MRFSELSLSAQTAYAELFSQTQAFELDNALAGLVGAFHKRTIKARDYWYFAYRDIDQKLRMVYVGPDNERVRSLVERFAGKFWSLVSSNGLGVAPEASRLIKNTRNVMA